MSETCTVCGRGFDVQFRYQMEERDNAFSFFCSQACHGKSLRGETTGGVVCDCCNKRFTVELVSQVVRIKGEARYACSEGCRGQLLARGGRPSPRRDERASAGRRRDAGAFVGPHPASRRPRSLAPAPAVAPTSAAPFAPTPAPLPVAASRAPDSGTARHAHREEARGAEEARGLQPQGRHRQDHDDGQHRRRPRAARATASSSSTPTRRATSASRSA